MAEREMTRGVLDNYQEGYMSAPPTKAALEVIDQMMGTAFGPKVAEKWRAFTNHNRGRAFPQWSIEETSKRMVTEDFAYGKVLTHNEEQRLLKAVRDVDPEFNKWFDTSQPIRNLVERARKSHKVQSHADYVDSMLASFAHNVVPLRGLDEAADVRRALVEAGVEDPVVIHLKRDFGNSVGRVRKLRGADSVEQIHEALIKGAGHPDVDSSLSHVNKEILDRLKADKAGLEGREIYLVPRTVREQLQKLEKVWTDPESMGLFARTYKHVMQLWKGYALFGPGYHFRNFISGLWVNHIAGVNPARYMDANKFTFKIKDMSGKPYAFQTATGQVFNSQEISNMLDTLGIRNHGLYGGELAEMLTEQMKRPSLAPWKTNFVGLRLNRRLGMYVENHGRIAHFLDVLKKTGDPMEAAMSVNKHLFDYTMDLPKWERGVQQVVPFWRWTRNNIPLQLELLVRKPGRMARFGIAANYLERMGEGDNPLMPKKYIPQFIKDGLGVQVRTRKDGTHEFFMLKNWLPVGDLSPVFKMMPFIGGTSEKNQAEIALKEVVDMIGPWKIPVETITNHSFFLERELAKPGQDVPYGPFYMDGRAANWLRNIRPINDLVKLDPFNMWPHARMDGGSKGVLRRLQEAVVGRTYEADPRKQHQQYIEKRKAQIGEYRKWLTIVAGDKRKPPDQRKREIQRINAMIHEVSEEMKRARVLPKGARRRYER